MHASNIRVAVGHSTCKLFSRYLIFHVRKSMASIITENMQLGASLLYDTYLTVY